MLALLVIFLQARNIKYMDQLLGQLHCGLANQTFGWAHPTAPRELYRVGPPESLVSYRQQCS